jgi:hypothetical protein
MNVVSAHTLEYQQYDGSTGTEGTVNTVCAFNLLMWIPVKVSGICSFPAMISLAEWHILKKAGDLY